MGWSGKELIPAAGTAVHARVAGVDGAPQVVCVHGLGCSSRYFTPFAGHLATDAHVLAPDLPGFGRTAGPPRALDVRGLSLALADWLRCTERGGAVLVANSLGCQIVADLALHSPDLLGPVVLVGPTMDRHARTPGRQLWRLLRSLPRERPSLALVLTYDYLVCGPRRFLDTFRHALADPVEHKLFAVNVPAVVVRGARDPIVPHGWAQEVADLLPAGRLVEVPGGGHALNYSSPAELAAVTRTLLPEQPRGEGLGGDHQGRLARSTGALPGERGVVADDSGSTVFKLVTMGATIGAAMAARKGATLTWKLASGTEPPVNPEDPDVTWKEALGWALISGAAIGVARMVASRQTAVWHRKKTGRLPSNLQKASS